jgi:hypothetical protein
LTRDTSGGIRDEAVAAAVDHVPGIGAGTTVVALRRFFADWRGRGLLVIDSLDESSGPAGQRVKAIGEEFREWRIVLTSRPSSWRDGLIEIRKEEPGHQVGDLQPLRYPEDVEAFIEKWFTGARQNKGREFLGEVGRSRSLQRSATVPLLLAFYCIAAEKAGGIPESRTGLFDLVVRRLLSGPWRAEGREPDEEECLQLLEGWAWAAAEKDPVSGVGTWTDEFPADASLREDDGPREKAILEAVAHVAVPLGPREYGSPDPVTRMRRPAILRRFIHRSVREYLVACYLAAQPWEKVADELVDHLWCDPDWEQAGPMALALHPERDTILRAMLRRVTRSEEIPADLGTLDSGLDLCRFLSETAMNRPETEWDPDLREVIAGARKRLVFEGHENLHPAPGWHACDRHMREDLVAQMTDANSAGEALGRMLTLGPDQRELGQVRQIIWGHMKRADSCLEACSLADAMVQAAPGPEERSAVREHLWGRLRGETSTACIFCVALTLASLGPGGSERERLRTLVTRAASDGHPGDDQHGPFSVLIDLVEDPAVRAVIRKLSVLFLASREEPPAEVLKEFLISDQSALRGVAGYLVSQWNAGRDFRLPAVVPARIDGWSAGEKALFHETLLAMLEAVTERDVAGWLAVLIAGLDPGPAERARALLVLHRQLAGERDVGVAARLANALILLDLDVSPDERNVVSGLTVTLRWLLEKLKDQGLGDVLAGVVPGLGSGDLCAELLDLLGRVIVTGGDTALFFAYECLPAIGPVALVEYVRLLGRLAGLPASTVTEPGRGDPSGAADCRRILLALLERGKGASATALALGLSRFEPPAEEREHACQILLRLVSGPTWHLYTNTLLHVMRRICPESQQPEVRRQLLRALPRPTTLIDAACDLVLDLEDLGMTAGEREEASRAVLALLGRKEDYLEPIHNLGRVLRTLRFDPDELDSLATGLLLKSLGRRNSQDRVRELAQELTGFVSDPVALRPVRQALLAQLAEKHIGATAAGLILTLAVLNPEPDDRQEVRRVVLADKAWVDDPYHDDEMVAALSTCLEPADLQHMDIPDMFGGKQVRASVRRRSAVEAWIGALPSIPHQEAPASG